MVKEFKEFIANGDAFDLAVGIILGIAFGLVVSSLVDDVIMQLIGAIFGQPSFNAINIHWGDKLSGEAALAVTGKYPGLKDAYENQIFIGALITKLINFIIVGLVLFFLVKAVNKTKRPKEVTVVSGPTEIELLTEIRRNDVEKLVTQPDYIGKIANKDVLGGHGDAALAGLIGDYEDVLLDHIPAHAGAMIKRQAHLLKQLSERSDNFYRNASA